MKNFFLTLHMISVCLVVGTLFLQSLTVVFRLRLKSAEEVANLETSGIGIVASCRACKRTPAWLGRSHPNQCISNGKLWNIKKINKDYDGPSHLDLLEARTKELS